MKVDEAFEGVTRLWQEMSLIVVAHSLALALAVYAHVVSWHVLWAETGFAVSIPELVALRASLQRVGLDLPVVAGVGLIVYIILFQRLSLLVLRLPLFRLSYSQTGLWRAGKCIDELRQLARWFKGITASTALSDLEVTLALAITQYGKDFDEHYKAVVGEPLTTAAVWTRYYSAFCLLALAALAWVAARHGIARGLLLPGGLLVAAMVARCEWEAQIERVVLGRLQFAIDCAIVSGARRDESKSSESMRDDVKAFQPPMNVFERQDLEMMALDVELLRLPPPYLPYEHLWLLHYVRQLPLFRKAGCIPLIRNPPYREWLIQNQRATDTEVPKDAEFTLERLRFETHAFTVARLCEAIGHPQTTEDRSWVTRILRSNISTRVADILGRKVFLVDWPDLCSLPGMKDVDGPFQERPMPFRKWLARRAAKSAADR